MERIKLSRAVLLFTVCIGLSACGGADETASVDIQATVAAQVEATLVATKPTTTPTDALQLSAVQPTETPMPEATVFASPQGKIAFVSSRGNRNAEIYVMNADGSDVSRLTNHDLTDLNVPFLVPMWSPNGEQIAFVTIDHNPADLLFVMDSSGADLTPIATNVDGYELPAWSPKGEHIAYVSHPEEMLTVIRMDGSEVTPLVRTPRFKAPITWLNDRQIMGFMINSNVCLESFCISDTQGANVTGFLSWEQIQKTCDHAYAAADWSTQNGLTLLCDVDGTARIYAWDAADSSTPDLLAQLDSIPIDPDSFYYSVALFEESPDHRYFALVYNNQLYIFHTDTGETRMLANNIGLRPHSVDEWQYHPQSWSPDSRMITLASDGDILVIDVESGSITNLTVGESSNGMPAWSP